MAYRKKTNEVGITILCGLVSVGMIGMTAWLGTYNTTKAEELNNIQEETKALESTKQSIEEQVKQLELENEVLDLQMQELEDALNNLQQEGIVIEPIEEKNQKYAYLTFDDGPSQNTRVILDFLKANNIKATFFVVKRAGFDDVYKRIVDEGHTLALHTDTHEYSEIYQSVDTYFEDLNSVSDYVKEITGIESKILRFPGGSNNSVSKRYGGDGLMDSIIEAIQSEGYIYFDWNVDSGDAMGAKAEPETIAQNVLTGARLVDEANILMHDAPNKDTTAQALPEIVEGLKAQGYTFKSITSETKPIAFK